jgi:hypothetical protein
MFVVLTPIKDVRFTFLPDVCGYQLACLLRDFTHPVCDAAESSVRPTSSKKTSRLPQAIIVMDYGWSLWGVVLPLRKGFTKSERLKSRQASSLRGRVLTSHLGTAVKADSDETVTNYWRGVMHISRSARCNIAKDFSYIGGLKGGHFGDHIECVRNGIQYKWLVYEDKENLKDWQGYLGVLPEGLSNDRVQCRVIPVADFGRIPWRVTMFRGQMTLCSPEPVRNSYGIDKTTITFDDTATNAMSVLFDELWGACPEVEVAASMTPQERDDAIRAHDALKDAFLQHFSRFYHKDVPIYRIEGTLAQMRDVSRETRTLILFTAAILAINVALVILDIILRPR